MYYLLFASVLSIVASQIHYENCEKLSDDLSLRWTLDTAVNGIYYNLEATDVPSGTKPDQNVLTFQRELDRFWYLKATES